MSSPDGYQPTSGFRDGKDQDVTCVPEACEAFVRDASIRSAQPATVRAEALEPGVGVEPTTCALQVRCSTN